MEHIREWNKSCLSYLVSSITFLVAVIIVVYATNASKASDLSSFENQAKQYLIELEARYSEACYREATAKWDFMTNITPATSNASAEAATAYWKFQSQIQKEILSRFPNWKEFKDHKMRREFKYLSIQGPASMHEEDVAAMEKLGGEMEADYSTATVCEYKSPSNCSLRFDPENVLQTSRDPDELAHYWTAWHDKMSEKVPPSKYKQFLTFQNSMANANGFKDMGDMWMVSYDDETEGWTADHFKKLIMELWEEIRPMYELLHAYVRMKLRRIPQYKGTVDKCGFIPAHLTGNMWAQSWTGLDILTKPFPNAPSLDATQAMIKNNYTVLKIFQEAERFFTNLGLLPMTDTFWRKSMLERPSDGREVDCYASSEDFCSVKGSTDYRIKQCTKINMEYLITAHHEMGHIQYFQQYANEHYIFRDAANPGFHEAIGDAIALAVVTPKHLQCILNLDVGLDDSLCNNDNPVAKVSGVVSETDINFLYMTALDKLPAFPFILALESWRWEAFEGKLSPQEYNKRWWELRMKYQGIKPPTDRSSPDLFDPAAKFHIVANVEYHRYFIGHILQFQIYEAMCVAAGEFHPRSNSSKPLYKCDFAGSKKAGKLLGDMMQFGFSKAWPVALEAITGSRKMSISSLRNYLQPLLDHMKKELDANGEITGFADNCESLPS